MPENRFTNFYKSSLSKLSKSLLEDESLNDLALGEYNTYFYAISAQSSKKKFYITMPINRDNPLNIKDLLSFLDLIKKKNKNIKSLTYDNFSLNMEVHFIFSYKKFKSRLDSSLDEITRYLNKKEYYSSCGLCGAEAPINLYSIDFKPYLHCDTCMEAVQEKLLRQKLAGENGPWLQAKAVFFGMLAGIPASLLWTVSLLYFGLNHWIFPAFIAISISYAFAKYNRQWNKKVMLVLGLIVIFSTTLTSIFITGLAIYRQIASQGSGNIGFSQAFQATLDIFMEDKALLLLNPKIALISLVSLAIVFINITVEYRNKTNIYRY